MSSQVPLKPKNAFLQFPPVYHKARRSYVTKSSHVDCFQHKYYCLNTVPQRQVCKPSEVIFSYQWCKYYPGARTLLVWSRTMCLVKWDSVYLLWSGEALARHWPKDPGRQLINRPDPGDPRNAALPIAIMVAWHVRLTQCICANVSILLGSN